MNSLVLMSRFQVQCLKTLIFFSPKCLHIYIELHINERKHNWFRQWAKWEFWGRGHGRLQILNGALKTDKLRGRSRTRVSVTSDLFRIWLIGEHYTILPSLHLFHKMFPVFKKMGGILAVHVWGRVVEDSISRGFFLSVLKLFAIVL